MNSCIVHSTSHIAPAFWSGKCICPAAQMIWFHHKMTKTLYLFVPYKYHKKYHLDYFPHVPKIQKYCHSHRNTIFPYAIFFLFEKSNTMDLIQSQRMCIANPLKNTHRIAAVDQQQQQHQHLTAAPEFGAPMALINSAFITLTFVYSKPWRNANSIWTVHVYRSSYIQCMPTCILYFLEANTDHFLHIFLRFVFSAESSFLPFHNNIQSERECICNSNLHRILAKMRTSFFSSRLILRNVL